MPQGVDPSWDQGWARWRVEMLEYFGEEVPPTLRVAAGLPAKEDGDEDEGMREEDAPPGHLTEPG